MYPVLISQIEIQSINSIIIVMPKPTIYSRHKNIYIYTVIIPNE